MEIRDNLTMYMYLILPVCFWTLSNDVNEFDRLVLSL